MAATQIQLQALTKRFGDFTAVEPLDLAINQGEFVVLLGPSGCGKTTTLRMIAGLETPTSGTITVAGRDVTTLRPGERDVAFVFQLFALYPHLNVHDNIAFPLRAAGLPAEQVRTRVATVAKRLALEPLLRRKPRTLSGGDQQRVSLARAMIRQPAAFLMDEPLGTLDADQREHTRAEIRAIHNELNATGGGGGGGATTVFVTHDQLEALSLADRIAVMNEGKLLQFGPPQQVYDHPATLFVAHFIGSPGMNFLKATRVEGGHQVEGTTLVLPTKDSGLSTRDLVLGIRPEYIRLDPAGTPATVEHTQRLGSHNLLTLTLGPAILKARVPATTTFAEHEQAMVSLDPAGMRWFNPTDGRALHPTKGGAV